MSTRLGALVLTAVFTINNGNANNFLGMHENNAIVFCFAGFFLSLYSLLNRGHRFTYIYSTEEASGRARVGSSAIADRLGEGRSREFSS